MSAFAGERLGGPTVIWRAAGSVTETTAKRGSTGSLYRSSTCFGATFTVRLATGVVWSSAA